MSLPQLMCSPPDYLSIKVNVDAVVRGSFTIASTILMPSRGISVILHNFPSNLMPNLDKGGELMSFKS